MKILFSSSSILATPGLDFQDFKSFAYEKKVLSLLTDIIKQNRYTRLDFSFENVCFLLMSLDSQLFWLQHWFFIKL